MYRAWLLARAEMVWENENQKVLPFPTLEQAQMWKPVVTARIDQLVNADRNIEQCADQIASVQAELQKKSLPLGLEQVEAVGEEWLKSVEDLTSTQVAIPSPPSESSKELESVRSPTSVVSSAASEIIVIKITTQVGEQPVVTAAYAGITVQQIVEAEMSIGDWHGSHSKIVICDEDGNVMSPKSPVMHDVHFFVEESVTDDLVDCGNENPIPSLCSNQIGKEEHSIGSSYASPLTQLKGQAFLRLKPPQVSSESQVQSLRAQKQLATDRCVMLDHQGMIWGDDEIVWHLQRIQDTCKKEMLDQEMNDEIPAWIDPLLFQGWVFHNDVCEVKQWHKSRDTPSLFFTVAINQSRWIPVIFRIQDKVFSISFLQTWPVDLQFVKQVANSLTEAFECTSCAMHPVQIPSVPESCGTAAILFLEEFLLVSPTPEHIDYPEMHSHYRAMFCEALKKCTLASHPWMWGAGKDEVTQAQDELMSVLKAHGVPQEEIRSRAQKAVSVIGAQPIITACQGKTPWRSLKALGNNSNFKFVLPDELQIQIQARAGKDAIGNPGKKGKGQKGSSKEPPIEIDPSKLSLPEGLFCCEEAVVPQIAHQQIGPVAEGVAIMTALEAEPYLRASKVVSTNPLAILVLNAPSAKLCTTLMHMPVTVPARCVINQEPLLIEATLVQLGSKKIERAAKKSHADFEAVQVATLKFVVYRDEAPSHGNNLDKDQ